jgi:hypothetical protein
MMLWQFYEFLFLKIISRDETCRVGGFCSKAGVYDSKPLLAIQNVIGRCQIISLWKIEVSNVAFGG